MAAPSTNANGGNAGRFIGAAVTRREDRRLLTGHGRYIDDVTVPGTLHAAFVRSSVARAMVTKIDVDEARRAPGVAAVLTMDDLRSLGGLDGMTITPPLADGSVRFVGDPIAMVIADNRALAE